MELFYRKTGSGKPLVILHGLYGSGDNWYSIARMLSGEYTVYLVDQRNHGDSPHHPVHDYKSLSSDLYTFLTSQNLDKVILTGHSMGGKTAMAFGLEHPEMIEKMIVVDISPLGYSGDSDAPEIRMHKKIIPALKDLDIKNISTRQEADRQLSQTISSPLIRQFLLKSLKRNHEKKFVWALNLDALEKNMPAIFGGIVDEVQTGTREIPVFPLLFIQGEKSGYIRQPDLEAIHKYFPHASVATIQNTGHWVHSEQPQAFVEIVRRFLGVSK